MAMTKIFRECAFVASPELSINTMPGKNGGITIQLPDGSEDAKGVFIQLLDRNAWVNNSLVNISGTVPLSEVEQAIPMGNFYDGDQSIPIEAGCTYHAEQGTIHIRALYQGPNSFNDPVISLVLFF